MKRIKTISNSAEDHNRSFHIPGSDASGFIVSLGNQDTNWKIGDEVVVNCNWHRSDDPKVYSDALISKEQKIWGYETNFGSLAPFSAFVITAPEFISDPVAGSVSTVPNGIALVITEPRVVRISQGSPS